MSTSRSYPSVFLSYSPDDRELAMAVRRFLHSIGLRVQTLADLHFGVNIYEAIEKAIRDADALIVLDSSHMRVSDFAEVQAANQHKRPILALAVGGTAVAERLPAQTEIGSSIQVYDSKDEKAIIQALKALGLAVKESVTSTFRIQIVAEPLTVYNLTTIISALTELSTKYWLIVQQRFADLIEYTQTHNGRFVEEANIVVTRVSYNSPFNMDWKVDLSTPSIAEALVQTIDGIKQRHARLEQVELGNKAKTQEIKHVEQQADHEQQMAVLEWKRQQLENEQLHLIWISPPLFSRAGLRLSVVDTSHS